MFIMSLPAIPENKKGGATTEVSNILIIMHLIMIFNNNTLNLSAFQDSGNVHSAY